MKKKITIPIIKNKKNKEKISVVTCYDYTFARLVEKTDIDAILVGDSLGMVIKGNENTLEVSIEEMIYHTKAVKKGAKTPLLIADMPFGSYQISEETAIKNAVKLIQAGAEAIKIEGGKEVESLIKKLVNFGIPVIGHLGLTPQHINSFGNFSKRGKTSEEQEKIKKSAKILEQAGVSMIVLESIPENLAQEITKSISIPTIGIGAGKFTDGQVLVIYDLLGLNDEFTPPFVKKYLNLDKEISNALEQYSYEVKMPYFQNK